MKACFFVCGDFNSRVGDDSDYIEGVDDVRPRKVLDFTPNANGDLPIDFLVDCGLCMINCRIGINNYTHVSHRGSRWWITCLCHISNY